MELPNGRAWIELDQTALAHNVRVLQSLLPPHCALMPVVKANAYGHGAVLISKALYDLGIRAFSVATLSEGIELRSAGLSGEILVLGYTRPEEAPLLHRWDLTQTAVSPDHAARLSAMGVPLRIQLKLDTGMHRLGGDCEDAEALRSVFALPNLRVTGVFSHLCTADSRSPDHQAFAHAQGALFHRTVERLRAMGCLIPQTHLLASYGMVNYPELGGSLARPGISLYGTFSAKGDWLARPVDLRPVLTLKARVAHLHRLPPNTSAGYGQRFTARRETRLAVATIGYADGLPRCLSDGVGAALLHGFKAPIAGRICMDQTLLDVTDLPPIAPGDEAVFLGRSGSLTISALDLAEQAGTITNEIFTSLGSRLDRFFV